MPTTLFNELFPDVKDPENPGHYLCRFCGKPTINTRRFFYCSDECYNLCQKAVSWLSARRAVWKRDGGKCVRCGTSVLLYDGWKKEGEGKEVAACHHVIPVRELHGIAYDAVYNDDWGDVPAEIKSLWFCRFYVMLYLDINNLITLCFKCHKMIHAADLRSQYRGNPFMVTETKWMGFWKKIDEIKYTRILEDFMT